VIDIIDEYPSEHPGDNPVGPRRDLQHAVLSPLETLAQSIAGIAPSATPGMLMTIVFGFAGNGTWLSYFLATIGILFTAQCINEYASRSACPGSLYTFVSTSFGWRAGTLTGWAMLFAYIFCGAACVTEFTVYAMSLTKHFTNWDVPGQLMMFMSTVFVGFIAYKNVKLSATLMLWLEFISIALILFITVLVFWKHGGFVDLPQIQLSTVSFENIRAGLVMAIFGFVGFESAASLGAEAKDPLKSIPRAIMRSVIISGLFFVFTSYSMVLSFRGAELPLNKCSTPLLTMADALSLPGLGHLIDAGIMMSFFGASLANLNAAARTMYKMGHNGFFHSRLSDTHAENQTPHVAVFVSSILSLSITMVLSAFKYPLLDIVGWLGTLATFGFIFAYFLTSASAAKMLRQRGELSIPKIVIVASSLIVLTIAFVGSVYPNPPAPYCWLPCVFAVYMILGALLASKAKPLD
jgi:amino acid transporter